MSTFKFGPNSTRVVDLNGNPWFIARDVGAALFNPEKIAVSGMGQYTTALAADERQTLTASQMASMNCFHGKAGPRATVIISESGLYKLVMRSNKPEAKAFQDWVTREVLPAY